jgi:ribosome maturation factor RimP
VLRDRLLKLIEPALDALGYELVLLEYSPGLQTGSLRLYIDAVAGVDLEDCERVSREVAGLLDVEDPIEKAYQLEVSSPGLDRPLTKPEHFERFAGEKIKFQSLVAVDGRKKFVGVLKGIEDRAILIEVDGKTLRVPLADVERARLVPDYAREFARANKGEPEGLMPPETTDSSPKRPLSNPPSKRSKKA